MKKIYTFRSRKGENEPSGPKNGIWGPKSVCSCVISTDREIYMEHEKNLLYGIKKAKIGPKAQKRNLESKNSMVV
jgi:hypothetical protein